MSEMVCHAFHMLELCHKGLTLYSIKRDIGHLCRDELKPATGKQAPPSIDTTSNSAVPGPSYASQVSVPQTMPPRTSSRLAADRERFDLYWPPRPASFHFPVPSNIISPIRSSSSPTNNMAPAAPPQTNQPWPGMQHPQPPPPPVQQQQPAWGSETLGNEFSVLT